MTISPINNQVEQRIILNIPYSFLVTPKKQSFWSKHETMIGITVSIAVIAAAMFYAKFFQPKSGCVEGHYDDWTNSICENSEFIRKVPGLPDRSRFAKLIEECANGAQIQGCLDGKFYRELTQECKDNPTAALCDGKYDYERFIKQVNVYSQ